MKEKTEEVEKVKKTLDAVTANLENVKNENSAKGSEAQNQLAKLRLVSHISKLFITFLFVLSDSVRLGKSTYNCSRAPAAK